MGEGVKECGFIVVGAGGWHSLGVMAMTKDGMCFGVRRASVATMFQSREDAALAIKRTNDDRAKHGYELIGTRIVRLIPVPKYANGKA